MINKNGHWSSSENRSIDLKLEIDTQRITGQKISQDDEMKNIHITKTKIDSGREKGLNDLSKEKLNPLQGNNVTYAKRQSQKSRQGKSYLPDARKEQINTENKKAEINDVNSFKGQDINENLPLMNEIADCSISKQTKKIGIYHILRQ